MPIFGFGDPDLKAFLTSKEYQSAPADLRQKLIGAYQQATPEQRKQFIYGDEQTEGLTLPPKQSTQDLLKTVGKAAPSLLGGAAKRAVHEAVPLAIDTAGQVGGGALGAQIGAPLAGTAAGGYLANQANKALGYREGKPFGSPTLDDVINTATPAVIGAVTATGRYTTKPAQQAVKDVDAKAAEYGQQVSARNAAIQAHGDALQEVPGTAERQVKVGDYTGAYSASKTAAGGANAIDLTNFNQTAKDLGVELRQPADPLQPKRYARLAEALGDFGAPQAPTTITSSLLGPNGQPITTMTGGSPGGESLGRVIATQRRLGQLIGKLQRSGGEELGAAKELYASLDDALEQAATSDPRAATAIEKWKEANAAYRKQLALNDYIDLFNVKKGYRNIPGVGKEAKTGAILDNFEQLRDHDRFFAGSFTPQELQFLEENLTKLPAEKIPNMPEAPDLKAAIGQFPWGSAIMGKSLGAAAGGAILGGQVFGGQPIGYAVGTTVGLGSVALPHWVSKALLAAPNGEQIVRSIIKGKRVIGPKEVAALTAVARTLGGTPDERGN
jgi:hypothetical protein